jgi:hypothetical protein
LFRRELLTELARAAYETVHELMAQAVEDNQARPGMVVAIQTFSDNLLWNPHLHCIVSRGVWLADGQWVPVAYVSTHAAEMLFREKVFRLLQQHDLLSDERINILRSWRRSGFSIDNDVYLDPSDSQGPRNPLPLYRPLSRLPSKTPLRQKEQLRSLSAQIKKYKSRAPRPARVFAVSSPSK